MVEKHTSIDLLILSKKEATARGLIPLTMAEAFDTPLPVGSGAKSLRYIDWLALEQQRITRAGDRQAEIVVESRKRVALWVDDVVSA